MAKNKSKLKRKAKGPPKANYAGNVILHLSDLHFGYDLDEQAKAERKNALDDLISIINNQKPDWKPTIICITGDIAMKASSKDYSEAKTWLEELLSRLKLKSKYLFICPGNHDVQRNIAEGIGGPRDNMEADRFLSIDSFENHIIPFVEFQKFCSSLSIPPYLIGDMESHLTGIRIINNIKFVCLNSAWFSQRYQNGGEFIDDGKLWVGLPLLIHFESRGDFPYFEKHADSIFTIVIFHHPFEILHENERNERKPRKNTQEFIAHRSHLILTGHDHGVPTDPTPILTRAFHFRGGATYDNSKYENSFHLIRLEDHHLLEKRFIYQPSSSTSSWSQRDEPKKQYYWDYAEKIIEEKEKQKNIDKIENNRMSFQEIMLQGDYENGLKILDSGAELLISLSPQLTLEEKSIFKSKYSDSVQHNLPLMKSEQICKFRKIMLRILDI
ncbi:MAG: metallophosphoesterase [Calditrichaceae bacterium]|nr:metallophosphoesterase [Calditrichaceae bacterium]